MSHIVVPLGALLPSPYFPLNDVLSGDHMRSRYWSGSVTCGMSKLCVSSCAAAASPSVEQPHWSFLYSLSSLVNPLNTTDMLLPVPSHQPRTPRSGLSNCAKMRYRTRGL